jgi:hypothetical protein
VGLGEGDRAFVGNTGIEVGLNTLAVAGGNVLHAFSLRGGSAHNVCSLFFCFAQETVEAGVECRGGGPDGVLRIVAKFSDRIFEVSHALGLLIKERLRRHELATELGNHPVNGVSVVSANGAGNLFGIVRHVSPFDRGNLCRNVILSAQPERAEPPPSRVSGIFEGILV